METVQLSLFEKLNRWIRESIMIKLGSIGFLILILLIPQAWIQSLMVEREDRAEAVVGEITTKWSGEQNIAGPVLVVPIVKREKIDKGKEGIEIREWTEKAFFLPEKLKITGKVDPQVLHRGIFEAAVYESSLNVDSHFLPPDFQKLNVAPNDVLWKDAYLVLGITDLRGISENPKLKMGDRELTGEPSNNIGLSSEYSSSAGHSDDRDDGSGDQKKSSEKGIVVKLPWRTMNDFSEAFSIQLNLKGSTLLYFVPVGKTTEVSLQGPWANPSFDGDFLPASRQISETGFTADWKILHYNRPFSQEWIGGNQTLTGAEFGVKLLIPVDQYQKSIRTAKYGILVILLTFISLFMVEIMKKVRIHPFQYILVGAALIIYYSLLLSLSEHLGYDLAYVVASLATVVLVALYSSTFLASRKLVFVFTGLLAFFYGFIFVIIQLQDYSLLLGSIGLFLTVGLLMYFSKGIQWYRDELKESVV
jgi:inner membrane protein